ncbi:disease resistance protein RPM1 [Ziziphus jujuba]|uniref:Disease resistance protein RPM1 n=1 Tax=Ziziphus jujuba TaxID=326968 RepID=A0ABM4AAT5_ZIZJJ|nr:disease resistance protein RPM1 [Ziziphus jujuba]
MKNSECGSSKSEKSHTILKTFLMNSCFASRIMETPMGHQRYRYKLNFIEEGSSTSSVTANNNWHDLRGDALCLEEAKLVGIDKHKPYLIDKLIGGSSELQVVAVAGMGGLGKTTLVRQVYKDDAVKRHFQHHAWVTVSQVFKLEDVVRDIVQQLFDEIKQTLPQDADSSDSGKLKAILADFLAGKRYLVVLDDVWQVGAWDALKYAFPTNNNGSRLMLTTRNSKVASLSTTELGGMVYDLKPLSLEESWNLYCGKTFQGNDCPPYLEKISKNILKKCEGLPLAIVAISGMLSTKDRNRMVEWEMVERSLRAELEGNDSLQSMKKILSFSFNDLPYNLKHCFLYISIFPEDYLIEPKKLIRFWIGEGFVQEKEGRILEEVGEGYFNELVNRSLIQVVDKYYDGRIINCRIHDLLREIILLKSKDQNFVSIIREQSRALPEKPRRLLINKPLENVGGEHNLSSLRSLFYFGAKHDSISNFSMSIFFNSGLRLLEVLNCRGAPLNKFPKEILKLYNLRYLSLRDTNVSSIPKSFGKLQKLYSLDFRYTYVTELPVEILQLKQLRQLLVYRYVHEFTTSIEVVGFKALRGLETLSSLQSLCYIEVNQGDSNLMKSLGELTQLRRLCILKLKAEDGNYLCSSIEKLRFVLSLSLVSISPDEVLDLQNMSSPPQCLRHLELSGRLETFPHWISYLSNLSHVGLQWSRLQVNPFESLQALPNLVVIEFVKAYDGETLYFKAEGFKMLKMLALGKFDRLKRVTIEKGALPVLEKLSFTDCKLLEEVPSGIEDLRNLQELELVDMSNEFLMKLRQRTDLMHIPDVFIGRETDCGLDGYFL